MRDTFGWMWMSFEAARLDTQERRLNFQVAPMLPLRTSVRKTIQDDEEFFIIRSWTDYVAG